MTETESKLTVKYISSEEGEKYYLVCEISNRDRLSFPLSMYLTDTRVAFSGELSEMNIKSTSADNLHSYNAEALLGNHSNHPDYSFSVEKLTENEVKLKWKRIQDRKKYQLGEIVLTRSEFDIINHYWKYSSETLVKNDEKIAALESTVAETLKELDNSTATVHELSEVKAKLENDLYAKFVVVLNGKKRKVQELETKIEDLEARLANCNENNNNNPRQSPDVNSGSETEIDTDKNEDDVEEIEEIEVPKRTQRLGRRKRENVVNPKPTSWRKSVVTSKASCSKTSTQYFSDSDELMENL